MKIILLTALIVLMLANASLAAAYEWPEYHNAATGLSFRYPPAMRIRERSGRDFGLPPDLVIIDLLGDTPANPDSIALRFEVSPKSETPQTAEENIQRAFEQHLADHDQRASLKTIYLGGQEALESVACGRAVCHWGVSIFRPHQCSISTLLGGNDANEAQPPPRDGTFPLLSIIKTVHFDAPRR